MIQRFVIAVCISVCASFASAEEKVGRGLAALSAPNGGVYLSWRLLPSDPPDIKFNLFRVYDGKVSKVNTQPISSSTNYIDTHGRIESRADYYVTEIDTGKASELAIKAAGEGMPYIAITTGVSTHGRALAVGDLKGRGKLDFVLRHSSANIDPYYKIWRQSKETFTLDAFDQDGNKLWQYDMGRAIEQGIWYSPYVVYDLDGDGKAELIVKAGDESMDPPRMRDASGRVMYGPEYLRVISGEDGNTVLAQTDWPDRNGFRGMDPPGTPLASRKYEHYNRWSRNFIGIAYLDGKTPHVIVNRGTYGHHKTAAYTYKNGALHQVWKWENVDPQKGGDREFWGQGAHSLQAADVDGDGRDEVIIGALVLDDDGTPLWSLDRGHVDHVYVGDLDPTRPGLELYFGTEDGHKSDGIGLADAATGKLLWGVDWPTTHIHSQGMCADIDPSTPGVECYSGEENGTGQWLFSNKGRIISKSKLPSLSPAAVWWDADLQKELVETIDTERTGMVTALSDFPQRQVLGETLPAPDVELPEDVGNFHRVAVMDLYGDWREEIIVADRNRLLVYMTTDLAKTRSPWLMADHQYRMGVASGSVGYYQQPMLSYDLAKPPRLMGVSKASTSSSSSSSSSGWMRRTDSGTAQMLDEAPTVPQASSAAPADSEAAVDPLAAGSAGLFELLGLMLLAGFTAAGRRKVDPLV